MQGLALEVAVVGEFERGKSSLINALLGTEVPPVGVLPPTAAPTVLERGDPRCVVEFADGRREQHPLAAVARFVSEEHNPGNTLGVAQVTGPPPCWSGPRPRSSPREPCSSLVPVCCSAGV